MPAPRPELENPPEIHYNQTEAAKYHVSTRVRHIQSRMTLRALELLNLPKTDTPGVCESALLLDIGCGSGISGEVLREQGHAWIGVDISRDMLNIAKTAEREELVEGEDTEEDPLRPDLSHVKWGLDPSSEDASEDEAEDDEEGPGGEGGGSGYVSPLMVEVAHHDIGLGLPFRPGSFDGCISISVLQWLCHSSKKGEVPQRRLRSLFQHLYNALRRGAKAVFQFYPSSPSQVEMVSKAAMKCGFSGGVVVDFPHSSKAKKHYLVLQAGQADFVPPPALLGDEVEYEEDEEYSEEAYEDHRSRVSVGGRDREAAKRSRSAHYTHDRKRRRKDDRPIAGTKDWVLMKKEERRRRGQATTADSKYTMRKRKPRF